MRTVILLFLCLFFVPQALAQARAVPDDHLTPGAVTSMTEAQVKSVTWGKNVRHVTPAMIAQVAKNYGIKLTAKDPRGDHDASCGSPRCEIDHRIPRECGGADAVANLWYQAAPYWHEKDVVENYEHKQLLAGKITLKQCQDAFRGNWTVLYRKITGRAP